MEFSLKGLSDVKEDPMKKEKTDQMSADYVEIMAMLGSTWEVVKNVVRAMYFCKD